jgi:hypothetical protein
MFKVLLLELVMLNEEVDEPLIVPVPVRAPAMLNALPLSDNTAPDCISILPVVVVVDRLGSAFIHVADVGIIILSELVGKADAIV